MSALNLTKSEMPRERLIACGAEAPKNEELLAILFGTGRQGCDVLDMSRELLNKYGSLKNLSRASVAELTGKKRAGAENVKGIGEAKAVTLLAALELGRRAEVEDERDETLNSRLVSWAVRLSVAEREFLVAIYLDEKDRPIEDERLSYGGLEGVQLDIAYLLRRAVRLDCASVALLHNHPDGDVTPSAEDKRLTRRIVAKLNTLEIGFSGHYIVGGPNMALIPDKAEESEIAEIRAASSDRGRINSH